MKTRILVADDHEMVRAGICSVLQRQGDNDVVAEASNGREAVEMSRTLAPDIVILDVTMPLLNGIEAARQIISDAPQTKAIMLSIHCEQTMVTEALRAGASAYLLKNSAAVELQLAIRAALEGTTYLSPKVGQVVVAGYLGDRGCSARSHAGGPPVQVSVFTALTAKQREVLQLLAEGKTNKEVAGCLHISSKTVEAHRATIMEKLNIRTVAGLTKYAIREGLTSVEV
jgi:DNA-binding NarL/FixJ family response regulator